MKKPRRRGTAISPTRRQNWLDTFQGYRHLISDQDIRNWLNQFEDEHKDIAARILDSVEYITPNATDAAYRSLLTTLPNWHIDPTRRTGIWKFVPFSRSPGESGDRMVHQFRIANNLAGRQHDGLFAYWSQLASLGANDTVVFIDDFSGSGSQVAEYWPTFEEVLANGPTAYLMLIATTTRAQSKIATETQLILHSEIVLNGTDDIFSGACKSFSRSEKDVLLNYCQRASPQEPKGRGACGLIVVLAHKAPNNSIAVLHKNNRQWNGLFRRYN